jgi:2-hydroxychromene-2-carboxylate isomerase
MKIINKISNFFSKKTISSSIRNKLMMDWSSEKKFFENRIKREKLRLSEKRPHIVYYFHSLTDPYSHLTCQILQNIVNKYDVELKILFVSDPHNVFTPERKMFEDYCLNDALEIAKYHGLKFENVSQPKEKNIVIAYKILNFYFFQKEITQIDFIKLLIKISSSLWLNETDTFNDIISSLDEKEKEIFDTLENSLLKEGNNKLSDFGYYFGSSFHYEGENYWGVDRLNHLEDRLSELNLSRENSQPYIINYPQNNFNLENLDQGQIDLKVEFFPSLNSPYTYISFKRIREIFEKYPVKFEVKPVLPMLMRNMKIPPVKAKYILSDAAREGRKHGVIIKKIYSPIGKPAERAYSLFPIINDQGYGFDYLEKLMDSCFFYGENIGEMKYLEKTISDLGLSWSEIKEELKNNDWKKLLNNNLNEMYKGGCWGVPTVRLSKINSDYEYYQWGQDRIHFIEKEIISILNFNHP